MEPEKRARDKMVHGIERQFNLVWSHLYRMMNDIKARRLAQFGPSPPTVAAAGSSPSLKQPDESSPSESNDPFPAIQILNREGSRKGSSDITFLEQTVAKKKRGDPGATQGGTFCSRYKNLVLAACGLEDPSAAEGTRTGCGTVTCRFSPAVDSVPSAGVTAETPLIPSRLKPLGKVRKCKAARDAATISPVVELPHPLFRGTILPESVPRLGSKYHTPGKKPSHEPSPSEPVMPYFSHAQQVGRPSPEQLELAEASHAKIQQGLDRFSNTIYGRKKHESPVARDRIIERRGREMQTYLAEQEKALRKSMLQARTFYSVPRASPKGHELCGKTEDPTTTTRFSIGKPQGKTRNQYRTYVTATSPDVSGTVASSRASGGCSPRAGAESTKALESANRILEACEEEQQDADRQIAKVGGMNRRLNVRLRRMGRRLQGRASLERDREMRSCKKFFVDNKRLFIYGKKRQGRYLSVEAKDAVQERDRMMQLNPRYPFLYDRLNDVLDPGPV